MKTKTPLRWYYCKYRWLPRLGVLVCCVWGKPATMMTQHLPVMQFTIVQTIPIPVITAHVFVHATHVKRVIHALHTA